MADLPSLLAGAAQTNADWNALPNINKSYWEGIDQNFKNRVRNVFSDGLPVGPDGSPDYGEAAKRLYQVGDIAGANEMLKAGLPYQQQQNEARAVREDFPSGGGPQAQGDQANIPPSLSRTASTTVAPAINQGTGQAQSVAPAIVNQRPGPVSTGENSIVGQVGKLGIPDELAWPIINELSARARKGPNDPLDPQTAQRVGLIAQQIVQRNGSQPQQAQPPQQQQAQQPQPGVVVGQGQPPGGQPQAQPMQDVDPARARLILQRDALLRRLGSFGPNADQATKKMYQEQISSINQQLQPTDEEKKAAASGMTLPQYQERQGELAAQQAGATEQAKLYAKKYEEINEVGDKSTTEIPKMRLALKQLDNPNYYSGPFNKYNLEAKRIVAMFGGNPDTAAPQEIVGKITADSILSGMGALKSLGPIRVQQMKYMAQASLSPDNSIPTQKLLASMAIRVQERAAHISDLAQNYNGGSGVIDAGFDRMVRAEDKRNPLFTDDEINNFHQIIDRASAPPLSAADRQQFPNARPGHDPKGNPGWYVTDPVTGKHMKIAQ